MIIGQVEVRLEGVVRDVVVAAERERGEKMPRFTSDDALNRIRTDRITCSKSRALKCRRPFLGFLGFHFQRYGDVREEIRT